MTYKGILDEMSYEMGIYSYPYSSEVKLFACSSSARKDLCRRVTGLVGLPHPSPGPRFLETTALEKKHEIPPHSRVSFSDIWFFLKLGMDLSWWVTGRAGHTGPCLRAHWATSSSMPVPYYRSGIPPYLLYMQLVQRKKMLIDWEIF